MNLYRYEDVQYAGPTDELGESSGPGDLRVELRTFTVIRETPKGAWIVAHSMDGPRFVNLHARKQYACRTLEEAAESFRARKQRQMRIHQAAVRRAQHALDIINKEDFLSCTGT